MPSTQNLGIAHIDSNQSQKEVTHNEGMDILDEAVAGLLIHDMATDDDYTLDVTEPATEDQNLVLRITDTSVNLSTTRNIILPDKQQVHVCENQTAEALNFKTATGTGIAVPASGIKLVYIDGSSLDATTIADDSGAASSLDFTDLQDSPSTYSGRGGLVLKVKGAEDGVEFAAESVPSGVFWATPFAGGKADRSSDLTGQNFTIAGSVAWNQEVFDSDTFVDIGGQASRVTIPVGNTKAVITASIELANIDADEDVTLQIYKNGSAMTGIGITTETGDTTRLMQVTTGVIAVSATDYFEAYLTVQADTTVDVQTGSFLQAEIIETTASENPPYDIGIYYAGVPLSGQEVFRMNVVRGFTFPSGAADSNASARVASTGDVTFSLQKGGVEFGTVRFNISATGVYTQASDAVFAEDDLLTIIAPATADATLEDISIALHGDRTS